MMDVSNGKQVKLVAYQWKKGGASAWWDHVKNNCRWQGKGGSEDMGEDEKFIEG